MRSIHTWTLLAGVAACAFAPRMATAQFLVEFEESKVLFEENVTDGDLGFHFKVDGDAWERCILFDPNFRAFFDLSVSASGNLRHIGLTELFSESAEPSYDEIPRQAILDNFEAGRYLFFGIAKDGGWILSSATLTKRIPVGAEVTSPVEDDVIDPDTDLVIEWEPVPDPAAPDSVIEFYEVVVERDEDEGLAQVLSVILPPDATQFTVPAEFFQEETAYKVEIIAEETSNNRSATEVPFETDAAP